MWLPVFWAIFFSGVIIKFRFYVIQKVMKHMIQNTSVCHGQKGSKEKKWEMNCDCGRRDPVRVKNEEKACRKSAMLEAPDQVLNNFLT